MDIMKQFRLDGKKGFITGAAQGIGKAIAEAFIQAGAEFTIVDVNEEKAQAVAQAFSEQYGRHITAFRCDVSDPQQVAQMAEMVVQTYGTIDFAINNVGIVNFFPVESVRPEDWKRVIDVNLFGTFVCAQAAAKVMIAQNKPGTIVNMASMSARIINTPQTTSSYCTSKAAVVHLTRSLAVELAKYNIRVNCVSTGIVATEVVTDWCDELQGWIDRTPQKRMGTPEDIAGAYLYLANDDIIGWVTIEDTNIDYPVIQTQDDPEFYLHRGFDKEYAASGVPFMDAVSDIFVPTSNFLIYGHNMKNGTMFHELLE